jgi:hypothetical protein
VGSRGLVQTELADALLELVARDGGILPDVQKGERFLQLEEGLLLVAETLKIRRPMQLGVDDLFGRHDARERARLATALTLLGAIHDREDKQQDPHTDGNENVLEGLGVHARRGGRVRWSRRAQAAPASARRDARRDTRITLPSASTVAPGCAIALRTLCASRCVVVAARYARRVNGGIRWKRQRRRRSGGRR